MAGTVMGGVEIRTVRADELSAFMETVMSAFLEPMDVDALAEAVLPHWDLGRVWAAFDGEIVAGTFRSWASELTLPGGGQLPGSAVAAVTTRSTHRRRGIMRSLAAAEHRAAAERGETVAMLHAAEYPIYGRLGYAPAARQVTWTLDTRSLAFHAGSAASIELVKPAAARTILPALFERHRARQAGEVRRRDYRWDDDLGLVTFPWEKPWRGLVAVHRAPDGEPDGYVRYAMESQWEHGRPNGRLTVNEMITLSHEAYVDLWRFLAEVDLVTSVKAERRRVDELLPHLVTDGRAATMGELADSLWVRIIDLPRVLAARSYEVAGSLIVEVVGPPGDPLLDRARLALDASPDGTTCTPTRGQPDVTVPLAALGAAVLGGSRLDWAAIAAGGVDEHRAGALAEATRLFRTLDEPWCTTFF